MQHSFRWAAVAAALLLAGPALAHEPYRVDLVPCTEDLCEVVGAAPLHEGRVEVDEDGDVEVELYGGPASAALCVKFQPSWGDTQPVGVLETDAFGHADHTVGEFEMGVFMGLFRVHEGPCEDPGAPLYVTAFGVGSHDDDEEEEEHEHGSDGEDDNDGDGIPNDEDPDDDNDGIDDVDDPDDDNDGIPDGEDADPDDANPFDDDAVDEAKSAYKAERRALKDEYKAEVSELRDELRQEVEDLREDLEDRLDD
jgi:hypothetical protein